MKTILITGVGGFIGFNLTKKLLNSGFKVIGLDNINDYYDVNLKKDRLRNLGINRFSQDIVIPSEKYENFIFIKTDISKTKFKSIINEKIDYCINLAAQVGVTYSIKNPNAYIESNILGFFNVLEFIKERNLKHFIFASSSSVYGLNNEIPFSETQKTDTPASLYATTKKSNELLGYNYSYLFNIPTSALRFFTVYGPWGRPDMFAFKLADSILNNKEINLFNNGLLKRDYTYIDDIVESIYRLIDKPPKKDSNGVKFDVFNIGNSNPISNIDFIKLFEERLGKKAIINNTEKPNTEIDITYSNTDKLFKKIHYRPKVKVNEGINLFIDWFIDYYNYNI